MILTVGGIKGGTGKTTIATNFAAIAAGKGGFVLLVDADEQESAAEFAVMRNDEPLALAAPYTTVKLAGASVRHEVQRLASKYSHIIIDTGGRDTTSQRAAISVSDRVLIPFAPRCFDVWTVGKVNALLKEMKLANPRYRALACLNRADPPGQGSENQDAYRIIQGEATPELEFLDMPIGNRKAFAHAATRGMAVTEFPSGKRDAKACEEIVKLYSRCFEIKAVSHGD